MTIRLLPATLIFCASAMIGGGCSTPAPPPPAIPPIESPKGLVGIEPCGLLDGDARATQGLGDGVPGQDELGASCRWRGGGSLSVQLTAYTSGTGLTDLTSRGDPSAAKVRLAGYPALETFTEGGGFCRTTSGSPRTRPWWPPWTVASRTRALPCSN